MEKEILEKIKTEFSAMKEQIEYNNEELKRLEQWPEVRRYIALSKEQRLLTHGAMNISDQQILDEILCNFGHEKIKETNNLWYFFGSYENLDEYMKDFFSCNGLNYPILVYINLENKDIVNIELHDKEKFESEHIIINKFHHNSWKYFNDLRNYFFEICIDEGQESAVKSITKTK